MHVMYAQTGKHTHTHVVPKDLWGRKTIQNELSTHNYHIAGCLCWLRHIQLTFFYLVYRLLVLLLLQLVLHFFPVARSFWLIMHTRTAHNLWSLHNFHHIAACVCIGNLPLAFAIISIIFFSFRVFRSICLALAFSYSINSMCFVSSIFAVAHNSLQGCHAMRHISTIVYSYCDLGIC